VRVSRAPFLDEYIEDDESAVLFDDGRVLVLSALATEAVRLVAAGTDRTDQLKDLLLARFGPPPPGILPGSVTSAVVDSLIEQGLLSMVEENPYRI
jgi:hypothetical protein